MTTSIRARCALCGPVMLAPVDLLVTVAGLASRYRFHCPGCCADISRPAPLDLVDILTEAGCCVLILPAEALERHEGPPLTLDDLIDFHEELNRR